MDESQIPRFNHVALSVPAAALDADGRAGLLDFYSEVFGFSEMPTMTKDRELLVLRCYSNEQFVYIHAAEKPMQCGSMEHFGMSVPTRVALDEMYERARKYADADSEVEVTGVKTDDFKVLELTSFYVRYKLPLMIEVQCYEWADGVGPQSSPS